MGLILRNGSYIQLLQAIKQDCNNHNWLIEKDDINSNKELYVRIGKDINFSFKAFPHPNDSSKILFCCVGNSGFDNSNSWDNQPNKSIVGGLLNVNFMILPASSNFDFGIVSTGDMVTIYCEKTGYVNILYFGCLEKAFNFDGGNIYGGSYGFWHYKKAITDGQVFDDGDAIGLGCPFGLWGNSSSYPSNSVNYKGNWYHQYSIGAGLPIYNAIEFSSLNTTNGLDYLNFYSTRNNTMKPYYMDGIFIALVELGKNIVIGSYKGVFSSGNKFPLNYYQTVNNNNDNYTLLPIQSSTGFYSGVWLKDFE